MVESTTNTIAYILGPLFRPISRWLLAPHRARPTWHYETAFVALVLLTVAGITSPNLLEFKDVEILKQLLIIWLSAGAVLGSFLHAKVGYRMSEAMIASDAPTSSCYEWIGHYWLSKEILWFIVFIISGAYPAVAGTVIFILYPAWRKIHIEERIKMREINEPDNK